MIMFGYLHSINVPLPDIPVVRFKDEVCSGCGKKKRVRSAYSTLPIGAVVNKWKCIECLKGENDGK